MKLTLKKAEILPQLAKAAGAAGGGRSVVPILECVLLEVAGGMVTITGTDLEVTIIAKGACSADMDGGFCLPAGKLLAAVKSFANDEFTITVDGNAARVASGRSSIRLPVLDADQFMRPDSASEEPIKLSAPALAAVLAYVKPAMAKQDVRYYLNGVLFEVADGLMTAVATDGHRMGVATMEAEGEWSLILPRRAVEELTPMLSGEVVEVQAGKSLFIVHCGTMTLVAKQIDGKYPDWRRVVPPKVDAISLATGQLRSALERAAIVAQRGGARLDVSEGCVGVQAGQGDEVVEDAIDAVTGSKNLVMGVNLAYVVDALKVAGSDEVEIEMTGPDTGMVVRAAGSSDRFTVVMPMRL